jgi:hypothetical protein
MEPNRTHRLPQRGTVSELLDEWQADSYPHLDPAGLAWNPRLEGECRVVRVCRESIESARRSNREAAPGDRIFWTSRSEKNVLLCIGSLEL